MKGNMKALRKMKPGPGLEMQQVPIPAIKAGEVLIQVRKRAICGTDLHIFKWDEWSQNRLKPPVTTGHEFYGEIVEAGAEVRHYKVGELVTAEMHVVCNQCFQCRTGNAHLCENVVILGVDGDGCFAIISPCPKRTSGACRPGSTRSGRPSTTRSAMPFTRSWPGPRSANPS
jgi:threonine 3-dehydrogenase